MRREMRCNLLHIASLLLAMQALKAQECDASGTDQKKSSSQPGEETSTSVEIKAESPQPELLKPGLLTIKNQLHNPVDIYWVPTDGSGQERVKLISVGAFESGSMNVFTGHVFEFIDASSGERVGGVHAKGGTQTHDITAALQSASICKDKVGVERCRPMVSSGACSAAPGWMYVHCAKSCNACEMVDPQVRCALERFNQTSGIPPPAEVADALGQLFHRIVSDNPQHSPTVHLAPPEGPWIVTLEDFVTEEEIDALLRRTLPNAVRSTDQGSQDELGRVAKVVTDRRTSSNAWCIGECESDPLVGQITRRIERLTGISATHFESFQVLSYNIGQEYKRHHDEVGFLKSKAPKPAGPRLLTVFIYLADVEEGGETAFPDLLPQIAVKPKKGRVLIWPSVRSDDHMAQDPRTHHEARPVIRGTKFAANAWIHLNEFRKPNLWGCTGSFDD